MNKKVSRKLAALLRDAGYTNIPLKVYDAEDENDNTLYPYGEVFSGDNELYAPTIADAVMWVWNTYKVWIVVWSDTNLDLPDWKDKAKWFYVLNCDLLAAYESGTSVLKYTFDTIEEAYEAGIEYVFKNKETCLTN